MPIALKITSGRAEERLVVAEIPPEKPSQHLVNEEPFVFISKQVNALNTRQLYSGWSLELELVASLRWLQSSQPHRCGSDKPQI